MKEVVIRCLVPDEWSKFRELRISALTTDPGAFCSTVASTAARPEGVWRSRLEVAQESETSLLLFADREGELVGMVNAEIEGLSQATLYSMYVDQRCRGLGVGRRLLEAVFEQLHRLEVLRVTLEVRPGQTGAIAFYKSLGFQELEANSDGNLAMSRNLN